MTYVANLETALTSVTAPMDVSTKIKEIVGVSLSVDSAYMRAKDTFKELMDGTKLTEVEYANAAASFVTALSTQLTQTSISAALDWAKQEKETEIVLAKTLEEIKGMQLQNELTSKQIDIAVIGAAKATSENLQIQAQTALLAAQKLHTDATTANVQAETTFIAKKGAQIDQEILRSQSQVNMDVAQIAKINAEIILLSVQDDIAFAELAIKQAEILKIPQEIALLTAQKDLTLAQKDRTVQESLATVEEIKLKKANAKATIASSIRENGGISSVDSDGMPTALANDGVKYTSIKVANAQSYAALADAYRKSGVVTIGTTSDGVSKGTTGDLLGYTNAQDKYARRQIQSFEDSKRSHAVNALSQTIGQLLATDIVPDQATIIAKFNTAIDYLNTNSPAV